MSDEKNLFSKVGLYGILGVVFLLPILFFPSGLLGVQFSKTVFFALVITALLSVFVVSRLKEKQINFFRSPLFLAAWGVPAAYLAGALFSENVRLSLFGDVIGSDTFAFILLGVIGLALTMTFIKSRVDVLKVYLALLASAFLVALFVVIRLALGVDALSFGGVFPDITSNPVGSWNDLAIFFGLVAILSMLFLNAAGGAFRYILGVATTISLFILALVNFSFVWWVVGLFALGSFVHSIVGKEQGGEKKGFSLVALIVLAVSIIFTFGNFIFTANAPGEFFSSAFNISQIEVRPSWQSTVDIAKVTYQENLLFGSGPNTFLKQYLLNKPDGINQTLFWNTDFRFGIGFVPTSFITTGIVGGIAWIVFFGALLFVGFRQLVLRGSEDAVGYHLMLSTFLASVYLWVMSVFYTPSSALLLLAFLMTGLFLVSLREYGGDARNFSISFSENPRLGFIAVLLLVVAFLVSIIAIFGIAQKTLAEVAYGQARLATSVEGAEASLARARTFAVSDRYERLGVAIELQKLQTLLATQNIPQAEAQTQFQAIFGEAIASAQRATSFDARSYLNWTALGNIYQAVVPLQITGAYENAVRSYNEAVALNPESPALSLTFAQLEVANGNLSKAAEFAQEAIAKKSNYTAAVFLLSQIQVQQGDVTSAIRSAEQAATLAPNDPVAFFQLGVLNYSDGKNQNAVASLERAVALDKNYSNARYFLGLGYYRAGNVEGAIAQFEEIQKLNPDNQEVKTILERLRGGQEPLPGFTRGGEELPEQLPIESR